MSKQISTVLILAFLTLAMSQEVIVRNPGCRSYNQEGICVECSERFYRDSSNICQPVNPNCNDYNSITGDCLSCYSGFGLLEGTCLPGLVTSSMDPNCNEFVDNECIRCSFGYYFGADGKCLKADVNCKTFNPLNGDCTSCYPSFSLSADGKCLVSIQITSDVNCNEFDADGNCVRCSSGYYFVGGTCTKIPDTCADFNTFFGICEACYPGYTLNQQNNCVEQVDAPNSNPLCAQFEGDFCLRCSTGSIFNGSRICVSLDPSCRTHDMDTGLCTGCYSGYILSVGVCILDENAGSLSDPNCNEFNIEDNTCIRCSTGYYFNDLQVCTKIDDNCRAFSIIQRRCVECYPGFALRSSGQCVVSVEEVSDPNCAEFENNICLRCSFGAEFNRQGVCVTLDPQCREYSELTRQCIGCYAGYELNIENVCVQSEDEAVTDPLCAEFEGGLCIRCSEGSFVGQNGLCVSVDPLCRTANLINGLCTTCYDGYRLTQNGRCVEEEAEENPNPLCAEFQEGLCIRCSEGSFFNSIGICEIVNPLCATYNPLNGNCLTCFLGYEVRGVTCVESESEAVDPFCREFDGQICIRCSERYYRSPLNGLCEKVSDDCREYNEITGDCLNCYGGFSLSFGACIEDLITTSNQYCAEFEENICIRCSFGAFLNSFGECELADSNCATFSQLNGLCETCYPGFVLENGRCIVDEDFEVNDPFCAEFNEDQICLRCSFGYYFEIDGKCTAVDPLCATYDPLNGDCRSCFEGFELFGRICIEAEEEARDPNCAEFEGNTCRQCSVGFYFNNFGICTQVNPLCREYNPLNGDCTACFSGYVRSGTTCIIDETQASTDANCAQFIDGICIRCSDRSFFNFDGICESVDPSCRTYDEFDGSCTTCYQGFALFNGECFEDQVRDGCAEFNENGICERCGTGYYLESGQCIEIDPQCARFDLLTRTCRGCYSGYSLLNGICQISEVNEEFEVENCIAYSENNMCLQCFDRYYLSENSCKEVSVFCKEYSELTGLCTSCYSTFTLQADGQCRQ